MVFALQRQADILALERDIMAMQASPVSIDDTVSGDTAVALDSMLAAHVRAYDVIHALRPDAVVTTNNFCMSVYEYDRMLLDVLLSRACEHLWDDFFNHSDWYAATSLDDGGFRAMVAGPASLN